MAQSITSHAQGRARIAVFDIVRGFTLVSMVCFHACYDLAYLFGVSLPWFTDTAFQVFWRCSISWVFLFLAGWMASYSRNNFKRSGVYALAALAIFAATTLASVDDAVNFGIMFCMAASTFVIAVLRPCLEKLSPAMGCIVAIAIFLATLGVPLQRYGIPHLAWLGFPDPSFASGDYYPLIPYFFMYLAGFFASRLPGAQTLPDWCKRDFCPPLSWLGKQSLLIYLAHQPLLLLVFSLVFKTL